MLDGYLVLLCSYRGDTYYLPPLGAPGKDLFGLIRKLANESRKNGLPFKIKAAPRSLTRLFAEEKNFLATPDRDNWDYLYRTKDLIELRGRKYQQKRNHINKFRESYDYSFEALRPEHINDCLELFRSWAKEREEQPINDTSSKTDHVRTNQEPIFDSVMEERLALQEALENLESLSLKGAVLIMNGRIEAFTLGSLLNQETALVHFEKANREYSGIYSLVNQHFAERIWAKTKYINREDDLGLPGLRAAKSRYHPVQMIEKYTIVEKTRRR